MSCGRSVHSKARFVPNKRRTKPSERKKHLLLVDLFCLRMICVHTVHSVHAYTHLAIEEHFMIIKNRIEINEKRSQKVSSPGFDHFNFLHCNTHADASNFIKPKPMNIEYGIKCALFYIFFTNEWYCIKSQHTTQNLIIKSRKLIVDAFLILILILLFLAGCV